MAKMNVSSLITKDYRKNDCLAAQKTNPNKPNSNPILSAVGGLQMNLELIRITGSLCKAQLFITIGIIGQIILKINK